MQKDNVWAKLAFMPFEILFNLIKKIMKKVLLISVLIIASFISKSQKVETDKFTGKKRIQSESKFLYVSLDGDLKISFRSNGELIFLELSGNKLMGVVGTKDPLILLFTDSTTIKLYPTSVQSTDGYGNNRRYSHSYSAGIVDIEAISTKIIASIRRYYGDVYGDMDIKEKKAKNIPEIAKWFIEQYKTEK